MPDVSSALSTITITAKTEPFEYDGIGNRQKSVNSLTLPTANNYTVNSLNQYTGITGLPVRAHDADGNLTSGTLPADQSGNSSLVWDAENRLVAVTTPDNNITRFSYDYQSRRISKAVDGSPATYYIYDGWNMIADYTAGTDITLAALAKTYTSGQGLSGSMQGAGGVGALLQVTDHGAPTTDHFYPTYDGNGNISEYLGSTGTVVAHYEYESFGNTTVSNGIKVNDFECKSSTKPQDAEAGLYYYGYRYYDPVTGRWPSRDPIGENGGLNIYGMVGNDSVSWFDFLGLKRPKCVSPENQDEFDDMWEEAKENGSEQTKKDLEIIDKSSHKNSVFLTDKFDSVVKPGIGENSANAHNEKGHGTHTTLNIGQGKSKGYSGQSVFEHEMNHVARKNEGNLPKNLGEREKMAIDSSNGGRKNRGEEERPYSDHSRITPEQIEEWNKEEEECKCSE